MEEVVENALQILRGVISGRPQGVVHPTGGKADDNVAGLQGFRSCAHGPESRINIKCTHLGLVLQAAQVQPPPVGQGLKVRREVNGLEWGGQRGAEGGLRNVARWLRRGRELRDEVLG